jgi:hypothetical protein
MVEIIVIALVVKGLNSIGCATCREETLAVLI